MVRFPFKYKCFHCLWFGSPLNTKFALCVCHGELLLKVDWFLCPQVLPLLRILYQAQERNSHHIYMALIILLVLSEDDVFNKAVHEIVSAPSHSSETRERCRPQRRECGDHHVVNAIMMTLMTTRIANMMMMVTFVTGVRMKFVVVVVAVVMMNTFSQSSAGLEVFWLEGTQAKARIGLELTVCSIFHF